MQIELLKEKPMRGCIFEHVGRIWLRRQNNNNYIFATRQFDSLQQILDRYNLDYSNSTKVIQELIEYIRLNFHKSDLIEFNFEDKENKIIKVIEIYDVKSKYYSVKRDYFEFCKTNYDFLVQLKEHYNLHPKIISIILLRNWNCDIQVFDFDSKRSRIYKYHAKK